jgi:hypothetical protein
VVTLVDRATRYTMVIALPNRHKADAVAHALIEQMGCVPSHLRRSLTWVRGLQMAHHGAISAALGRQLATHYPDGTARWTNSCSSSPPSVIESSCSARRRTEGEAPSARHAARRSSNARKSALLSAI